MSARPEALVVLGWISGRIADDESVLGVKLLEVDKADCSVTVAVGMMQRRYRISLADIGPLEDASNRPRSAP